jgi:hypothetical protein
MSYMDLHASTDNSYNKATIQDHRCCDFSSNRSMENHFDDDENDFDDDDDNDKGMMMSWERHEHNHDDDDDEFLTSLQILQEFHSVQALSCIPEEDGGHDDDCDERLLPNQQQQQQHQENTSNIVQNESVMSPPSHCRRLGAGSTSPGLSSKLTNCSISFGCLADLVNTTALHDGIEQTTNTKTIPHLANEAHGNIDNTLQYTSYHSSSENDDEQWGFHHTNNNELAVDEVCEQYSRLNSVSRSAVNNRSLKKNCYATSCSSNTRRYGLNASYSVNNKKVRLQFQPRRNRRILSPHPSSSTTTTTITTATSVSSGPTTVTMISSRVPKPSQQLPSQVTTYYNTSLRQQHSK